MAKPLRHNAAVLKLPIPFYRQATEFSCGPACLMMAMKFFQPSLHLTRGLEFDIWREANLVESYGTSKEGLALAAARRGFDVYTMGKTLRHSFVDAIADRIPGINHKTLELLYNDTRAKFRFMSLRNVSARVQLWELKRVLEKSQVPILLTSTSLFGKSDDLPHWVVLTGYGKKGWYVNNPLGKLPNTRLSHRTLEDNLGYHQIRCAVIVQAGHGAVPRDVLLGLQRSISRKKEKHNGAPWRPLRKRRRKSTTMRGKKKQRRRLGERKSRRQEPGSTSFIPNRIKSLKLTDLERYHNP